MHSVPRLKLRDQISELYSEVSLMVTDLFILKLYSICCASMKEKTPFKFNFWIVNHIPKEVPEIDLSTLDEL